MIHTDTYQGIKAAELIQSWGSANNISMQPVKIDDLNTGSIEEFMLGVNNLVEWCAWTLPGYRSQGYKVIFNLVGGFKSLQGYMQTLGMFYAIESNGAEDLNTCNLRQIQSDVKAPTSSICGLTWECGGHSVITRATS